MRRGNRVFWLVFIFIVVLGIAAGMIFKKDIVAFVSGLRQHQCSSAQAAAETFRAGERFVYQVKLGLLKVGSAELIFHGQEKLGSRPVYVITFEVRLAKIYDKETIYVDTADFYPVKVERALTMFGAPMTIVEEYDQQKKTVTIHKTERGKTTAQTITGDMKFQNIIALVYSYRMRQVNEGAGEQIDLPTKKIQTKISKVPKMKVPYGTYPAYLLESTPKQYKIWFAQGDGLIPLRADGVISFNALSMVLSEVH